MNIVRIVATIVVASLLSACGGGGGGGEVSGGVIIGTTPPIVPTTPTTPVVVAQPSFRVTPVNVDVLQNVVRGQRAVKGHSFIVTSVTTKPLEGFVVTDTSNTLWAFSETRYEPRFVRGDVDLRQLGVNYYINYLGNPGAFEVVFPSGWSPALDGAIYSVVYDVSTTASFGGLQLGITAYREKQGGAYNVNFARGAISWLGTSRMVPEVRSTSPQFQTAVNGMTRSDATYVCPLPLAPEVARACIVRYLEVTVTNGTPRFVVNGVAFPMVQNPIFPQKYGVVLNYTIAPGSTFTFSVMATVPTGQSSYLYLDAMPSNLGDSFDLNFFPNQNACQTFAGPGGCKG